MTDEENAADAKRKAAESLREHDRMTAQAQETKPPYQSGAEIDGNSTVQQARDVAAHTQPLHERGEPNPQEIERDLKEHDAWANEQGRDTWGGGLKEADVNRLYEQEAKSTKGGTDGMTLEQQDQVDKSVATASIQRESIGGASDVTSKPTPSDPSSMEQARDIGAELQKSGVEMDRS